MKDRTYWHKEEMSEGGIVRFVLVHKGHEKEGTEFFFVDELQRYHMNGLILASRTERGAKKEVFELAHRSVMRHYLEFAVAAIDLES